MRRRPDGEGAPSRAGDVAGRGEAVRAAGGRPEPEELSPTWQRPRSGRFARCSASAGPPSQAYLAGAPRDASWLELEVHCVQRTRIWRQVPRRGLIQPGRGNTRRTSHSFSGYVRKTEAIIERGETYPASSSSTHSLELAFTLSRARCKASTLMSGRSKFCLNALTSCPVSFIPVQNGGCSAPFRERLRKCRPPDCTILKRWNVPLVRDALTVQRAPVWTCCARSRF